MTFAHNKATISTQITDTTNKKPQPKVCFSKMILFKFSQQITEVHHRKPQNLHSLKLNAKL
jgi:hypothetical protein